MTLNKIYELLMNERACVLLMSRNVCDRNCAECYILQDNDEVMDMYTDLIHMVDRIRANGINEPDDVFRPDTQ